MLITKVSRGGPDQTLNNADVTADDADTVSGLLEAVAVMMMGIQTALDKVRPIQTILELYWEYCCNR